VVYPWVVDCAALRAAGWHPSVTNAEALTVLLAARGGHHAVAGLFKEPGHALPQQDRVLGEHYPQCFLTHWATPPR